MGHLPDDASRTIERPPTKPGGAATERPVPGAVVVWSGFQPLLLAAAVDGGVVIGRRGIGPHPLDDAALSRTHARIAFDDGFLVTDLDSRNGTFVDGERITGTVAVGDRAIVRIGTSIVLLFRDARRMLGGRMEVGSSVRGPILQTAHAQVAAAAREGGSLHLTGDTGAGKEVAARVFHESGPNASGPFVAINCATIPDGVAERLLFGARKGAFSGATADADGYIQAADGGTLFLDEVAELDAKVQAKLLRVLETREVLALGATRPRAVRIQVCSATHRGLRDLVAAGRFREDLYFRIGRPEVAIPPLQDRREEIPFLVQRALDTLGEGPIRARPSFIEACVRRPWPGNVRELLGEVTFAGRSALRDGAAELDESRLSPTAGRPVIADPPVEQDHAVRKSPAPLPDRSAVDQALATAEGNVSRAAAALGIHRNQLRRLIERHAIAIDSYRRSK